MHPRNRYRNGHDFPALARIDPALGDFLLTTPDGRTSLDFGAPEAVRRLNRALLLRDYGLRHWDIPAGNLVPPVPGRLDYIHAVADLLGGVRGPATVGLDIGTGAGCIYPILGSGEYDWRFVATDISADSLRVAGAIVRFNPRLEKRVELRQQDDPRHIFRGVIRPDDRFAFTLCNPPFYGSAAEATAATRRKWAQLTGSADATRNFGGQANELHTPGGEAGFLRRMIAESADFGTQVGWFTTLVSQRGYLKAADQQLDRLGVAERRVLPLAQGKKVRRVLGWRF